MDTANSQADHIEEEAQETEQQSPTIDVQQLAERVYRLMLADVRLERARGEQVARRRAR